MDTRRIEEAATHALERAALWACRSYPFAPDEENVLRGLFVAGLPVLHAELQTHFSRSAINAEISGIFCHGNPLVQLLEGSRASAKCELGDLLVLSSGSGNGGVGSNRALLLQTKIPPEQPTPAQSSLYREWPRFRYLGGIERKVTPSQPHAGARFATLCIDCRDGQPTFAFSTVQAGHLRSETPLASELAGLIAGHGGRGFADRATAREGIDWDAVVWDLIERTAKAAVRGVRRGWNTAIFMTRTATTMTPTFAQLTSAVPGFAEAWESAPLTGAGDEIALAQTDTNDADGSDAVSVLEINLQNER